MFDASLKAKVRAVNTAGAYANQLKTVLDEFFQPLIGQKILKADGSLMQKFKDKLPEFPSEARLSVYKIGSNYGLAWKVKVSEPIGDGSCLYHEIGVYVGNLNDCVLTDMCKVYNHRTDYTFEEVKAKQKAVADAEKALNEARSAMYPFDTRY